MKKFLFAVTALVALGTAGSAEALTKSLFLSDLDPNSDAVLTNLIGSDPRFDVADSAAFNWYTATPTLSYLEEFNSILFWGNYGATPSTNLLNLLGEYVENGGRVVIATFFGADPGSSSGLLNSTGFNPLINPTTDAYTGASLGTYDASSPLMAGVTSLTATDFRGDYLPGLDTGATLVASWSDGRPLEAINADQDVIDITLYPNIVGDDNATGDYQQLFANALAFTPADTGTTVAAPEPASIALLATGAVGAAFVRRKRVAVPKA